MIEQEVIGNLIKSFHLAVTYLKIYPLSSQMVVSTFDAFARTIQSIADKNGTLTFSELSGKLLIDGVEADSREVQLIANNIIKLFANKKIQSITFRAGLTKDELMNFITNIIRKKRDELPEFSHIALDQTVYVAMIKGEEAVVKIAEMIAKSGGEISGLMKMIRESYDLIDKIPEGSSKALAQDRLAQELAKQDTGVLREIFEHELPAKIEESGLKPKLLNALSQDKIQGIFGEISAWYDEIRKNESSDFAAVDQLEKLKVFIKTILRAPAAKEIPKHFFEELIKKGLLEQLPDWFSPAPSKPTTVFEVEKLLEKNPEALIEKQTLDNIPQLVEKLCQIENNELLVKLTEKILENLKNSAAKIRLPAAQCLLSIYQILQTQNKELLIRYMELPLLEATKKETSAEIHSIMEDILRKRARQNLLHGEYDLAIRIVDIFRQHLSPELMPDEKIRQNTRDSFGKLIPDIIEILISDLKSDNEVKRLGSLQILSKMEEKTVEPLIRVIKESEDIRSRRLAALALKNLGPAAIKRFSEELNLGLLAEEIKRVVEALSELGSGETIEQLNSLLRFPDASVKKEILKYLAKTNTPQSRIMIIEQLKDKDKEVVTETIRLLGEIKCTEAAGELIKLLNAPRCKSELKEEICIVLGTIGDPKSVPSLLACLKNKSFWNLGRRSNTERVRMRAAWALRKFKGTEIEKALEAASGDKSSSVALTAKESLNIIKLEPLRS
jgi:HEAT repeat protein